MWFFTRVSDPLLNWSLLNWSERIIKRNNNSVVISNETVRVWI